MRFTVPPTPVGPGEDTARGGLRPPGEGERRDRRDAASSAVDLLRTWIPVLLPVYLFVRVFVLAAGDPGLVLEVVRQQGLSGIAEAAVVSVVKDLAGLVLLAAALAAYVAVGPSGAGRRPVGAGVGAAVVAGLAVGALVAPLSFVLLTALLLLALLFASARALVALLAGLLGLLAVLTPVLAAPWLPYERVTWPGHDELGYVLGESEGFTSVLVDEPRKVELVTEVTSRTVCRPDGEVLRLEAPSLLDVLMPDDVPACGSPESLRRTATVTATATATATAGGTATATATATASPTATVTATRTATVTATPTVSTTVTATPTPTPTPTVTVTAPPPDPPETRTPGPRPTEEG